MVKKVRKTKLEGRPPKILAVENIKITPAALTEAAQDAGKKVKFELSYPTATRVAVTGDFNRWDKNGITLTKGKNGVWTIDLSLKPAKYQYKFIVDGEWKTDPQNKFSLPNAFGTENSVKEVL